MKAINRAVFGLMGLVFLLTGPAASALTPAQLDVLNSGIHYFNVEDNSTSDLNSCVGSGSLPSYVPEPYNGAITAGAKAHNVAPELIAALFTEENFTGIDPSKISDRWTSFVKDHPDPNSGWGTGGSDGSSWPDGSQGAHGPFQFEPDTWKSLGEDGNNDGQIDPNNLLDAAYAAANYAKTDGATTDQPVSSWSKFIYSYNHAQWYVDAVMLYYRTYVKDGGGSVNTDPSVSSCGNVGISADGFVFPQVTTKASLAAHGWNPDCTDPISEIGPNPPTTDPTKYQRQSGLCHHDYLAADIFNATGTPVVAVRPGRIISAHDGGIDDNGCPFGMTVRLYSDKSLGGDGLWYYYAHMLKPSEGGGLKVQDGETVKAGDQLGVVGTARDAECTTAHTHFDVSPVDNSFHRGFDGTAGPLLDPMPVLKSAYEALPDK